MSALVLAALILRHITPVLGARKRENGKQAYLAPELVHYLLETIIRNTTAYTVEDFVYKQIADTEDMARHRRKEIPIDLLVEAMRDNVDASAIIWKTAISEQEKNPNSPYFIIANERTGPSDVGAEGFSDDFSEKMKINKKVDHKRLFDWFLRNRERIDRLYDEFLNEREVASQIYQEVNDILDLDHNKIIPIYRLRIPSNHHEIQGLDEPLGFELIISFIKLISLLNGSVLFVDESTRSAPRSMEILYDGLRRRDELTGGVELTPHGKILGITGQRGITFNPVKNEHARCRVGFIDPWIKPQKPITDDSEGFAPRINGQGVIEIIDPGWGAISSFGTTSLQDFCRKLIVYKVEKQFESSSVSSNMCD